MRMFAKALATAAVVAAATQAVPAGASTAPTKAAGCETLRATVNNSQGMQGGTVQATFCITSGSVYTASGYYNYVEDHQPDGVAARAWVRSSDGSYAGPLATDSTSTSGGTTLRTWESNSASNTWVRVYVCLGTTDPASSGARCASDIMYA